MSDAMHPNAPWTISRRQLLASTGVLTAAAGVGIAAGTLPSAVAQPAAPLHASTFSGLVGHAFRFAVLGAQPVSLTLESVDGIGGRKPTELAFALRFSGPRATKQGGEVGALTAPGLAFTLLVVPSGRPSKRGQDWVATIAGGSHHD